MSNKIDELWGEALDKAVPNTYSSLTWTQVEKIKTVFAELIVRECSKFAEQYIDERCDRDFGVSVNMRKHFGVE